jgi:integrase/recombinase XerD
VAVTSISVAGGLPQCRAHPLTCTIRPGQRAANAAASACTSAIALTHLFGLLSVSGLRLGEARNLELQDVDLQAALLTIRGAKFGKTRLVPLHSSTCHILAEYIRRRSRHWRQRPVSSYLFVSSRGNQLDGGEIHRTFYALSRQIDLRGPSDSHGPRIHDLRHRFATNTLLRWYRSNQDPERKMPLLSAYLGHVHVADTQWYLSASPELMREAMHRLEHRWEGRS